MYQYVLYALLQCAQDECFSEFGMCDFYNLL